MSTNSTSLVKGQYIRGGNLPTSGIYFIDNLYSKTKRVQLDLVEIIIGEKRTIFMYIDHLGDIEVLDISKVPAHMRRLPYYAAESEDERYSSFDDLFNADKLWDLDLNLPYRHDFLIVSDDDEESVADTFNESHYYLLTITKILQRKSRFWSQSCKYNPETDGEKYKELYERHKNYMMLHWPSIV